jgi:hypothetical protein
MSLIHCKNCGAMLPAPDVGNGHAVRCRKCGYTFAVPDKVRAEEPPPPKHKEVELPRRRHRPETEEAEAPPADWVAPTVILILGLVVAAGGAVATAGAAGVAGRLVVVLVNLAVLVPVTIAILFAVRAMLRTPFGPTGTAVLKLAAINVLLLAIFLTANFAGAPALGILSGIAAGWGLFTYLFDPEWYATIIFLFITAAAVLLGSWALEAFVLNAVVR